jgi:peptidoglycan/xylan/chitin deacetylase (PgdA/CDA1 family)
MYHSITEEEKSNKHAYFCTSTSPAVFSAQMELLHRGGYQVSSLAQAGALLEAGSPECTKTVVITFDDGYHDFYQSAFPILNYFGFTATVFLPTAYIGESTVQFKGHDCLTWSEVRELQKFGISFGSHTVTHPKLFGLGKDAIDSEIVNSKRVIEEKTGRAVNSFAYPYAFPQANGEFRNMLRELLRGAGYSNGVCTMVGRAGFKSDPLFLERIPMNAFDDTALFHAKLSGAYDWVAKLQAGSKVAKSWAAGMCRHR